MGRQIDADEFIKHTENMLDIATRENNTVMKSFLSAILIFFNQYLDTFEKWGAQMFYLETKDGERFLTDPNSNDRKEFEKIVEDKMGPRASQLYNDIVDEAYNNCENLVSDFEQRLDFVADDLGNALSHDNLDVNELENILSDLQCILSDMRAIWWKHLSFHLGLVYLDFCLEC